MKESAHQYIRLTGTPHERGVQYGKAAYERIRRTIEEYKILFEKEAHIPWEKALERARKFEQPIAEKRPELLEEMKGIAEGAELDFNTILLLNARSEVMFATEENECTAILIPEGYSKDGSVLMSQNWDWWSIGEGTTVLLEIEQYPHPKTFVITEAGLVGGKGMNEAGIGVTLNALSITKGKVGLPLQLLLRCALCEPTVPRAIDAIVKSPRAGCGCVGLGSADGLALFLEYTPSAADIIPSNGKPLCHTNHWLSLFLKLKSEASQYSFTSTYTRLNRAIELVERHEGKFSKDDLFRILSDHAGYPDSICRHPAPSIPVYHHHTSLWSVAMDLRKRELWLTEGSPCQTEARCYRLF